MTYKNITEKAVRSIGSVLSVSKKFGFRSSQSVANWIINDRVPSQRVIALCEMGGWVVTPHELRPDLHPNPTDGLCCGVPSAPDRQIAGGCQPGMSDLVSASVRESAEAHCAAISNAPLAVREREAIEAIEALAPFAPGHRVLILPRAE